MASVICHPKESFTGTWNLRISCSEIKIHWKLLSVTLDLLPTPIRKSTFLSGAELLALWLPKLSTSRTCLSKAKPSVISFLLESSSITYFWINLSSKAQDTAIFWPKTELAILTSTKKNTTISIPMLSTF